MCAREGAGPGLQGYLADKKSHLLGPYSRVCQEPYGRPRKGGIFLFARCACKKLCGPLSTVRNAPNYFVMQACVEALAGARENVQGKVEHLQEELAHLPLLENQVGAWGCCLVVCSSKVWRSGIKELADTGKKVQGKVERVEVSLVHPFHLRARQMRFVH